MPPITIGELANKLKELFLFLEAQGYTYAGCTNSSDHLLGRQLILNWQSIVRQRKIRVTFFLDLPNPKESSLGLLTMHIENTNPPDVDEFDYYTMNTMNIPLPRLSQLEGEFINRLNLCVQIAKNKIDGEFNSAISGKTWKPDVFDWMDLK